MERMLHKSSRALTDPIGGCFREIVAVVDVRSADVRSRRLVVELDALLSIDRR